jgi:hypothetical protein
MSAEEEGMKQIQELFEVEVRLVVASGGQSEAFFV